VVYLWENIRVCKPAQISSNELDKINRTVLRYETAVKNKVIRWWNLLEQLQARRLGEPVPLAAPLTFITKARDWVRFVIPTGRLTRGSDSANIQWKK
jgi:hypothetical protein